MEGVSGKCKQRWHQLCSLVDRTEREWPFIIAKGIICNTDMRYIHTHTHTHTHNENITSKFIK